MKRSFATAVAALALAGGQVMAAQASTTITLPAPGSAAKVASLVTASTHIAT